MLLDAVKETFAAQPETVLADAGYCNERDLTNLEIREDAVSLLCFRDARVVCRGCRG